MPTTLLLTPQNKTLSSNELTRQTTEEVIAQQKFVKETSVGQAAHEVEKIELKRKAAIKEKELATSETVKSQPIQQHLS